MTEETDSLCARCAASGYTCCHNTRIILTHGDLARIAEVAGEDFYEYVNAGKAGKRELEEDPIWAGLFAEGRRLRVLRRQPDGRSCHFLAPNGCRLTLETRPLICRLYPYDYTHGSIKGVHAPYCPEPESDDPDLLLALLGMHRDTAEQWRIALYKEIGEELRLDV